MVNASPDLPAQVETFSALQPALHATSNDSAGQRSFRGSPIAAVCLTNADIDHVLGLILLRQRETPLPVYTTPVIRDQLRWIDALLEAFCPIEWRHICSDTAFEIIELGKSVGFIFRNSRTNRTVLVAPAVAALSDSLSKAMDNADVILFDGAFWSDDELKSFRLQARSAREMGHVPVQESLPLLKAAGSARKIYMHINNTNPILQPGSAERRQVEAAGVEIGYDGLEFDL